MRNKEWRKNVMQSAAKHLYCVSNPFSIEVKMLRCALHDAYSSLLINRSINQPVILPHGEHVGVGINPQAELKILAGFQ